MKAKVILLILLTVFSFSILEGQKKKTRITITGSVVDARHYPVSNAIIMIDGKNTNEMTDSEGKFKIKVKQDVEKIGVVSFANGMIEEPIDGRLVINFKYGGESITPQRTQETPSSEEAVNIGYDYTKAKDLTTPVNRIDGTDNKYRTYNSVYEIITREVSGVRVNGNNIVIHGASDLFGDVPALLIVDGVPVNDFNGIPPSAVESISVLKGASAAIYGSRGYGGAVVVTTKKENK